MWVCILSNIAQEPPNLTYWKSLSSAPISGAMIYTGNWSNSTNYVIGDVVRDSDLAYICISNNSNQEPPNTLYWLLAGTVPPTPPPAYYIDSSLAEAPYETLVGDLNGINTLFTVSQAVYKTGSLVVYLNGQQIVAGVDADFVETTPISGTFTMTVAPISTDRLVVMYQTTTGGGGGGGGEGTVVKTIFNPFAPPSSPSLLNDEFSTGTFDSSKWTIFDENGLLTISEDDSLVLDMLGNGTPQLAGIHQVIPDGDFTIWAKCSLIGQLYDFTEVGLALWEDPISASNPVARWGRVTGWGDWTGTQFQSADDAYYTDNNVMDSYQNADKSWFALGRSSSINYYWGFSADGIEWGWHWNEGLLSFSPTHFGVYVACNHSATIHNVARISFFRYAPSWLGFNARLGGNLVDLIHG